MNNYNKISQMSKIKISSKIIMIVIIKLNRKSLKMDNYNKKIITGIIRFKIRKIMKHKKIIILDTISYYYNL